MTDKKIALVTGANRGIGFEIARQLGAKDVIVYVAARQLSEATEAAAKIPNALPLQLDVTNQNDILNAAKEIGAQHQRLDILVNNAGVNLEENGPGDAATLRRVLEINTVAPYAITQAMLPLLKKSNAGRIVNQSSILGSISNIADTEDNDWMLPGYSSSKAALNMLTVVQANKLKGTMIKVNAAHPGWVKTRMGGDEAPLSPTEGAETAVRLALLPENGPTGGFFHGNDTLPW